MDRKPSTGRGRGRGNKRGKHTKKHDESDSEYSDDINNSPKMDTEEGESSTVNLNVTSTQLEESHEESVSRKYNPAVGKYEQQPRRNYESPFYKITGMVVEVEGEETKRVTFINQRSIRRDGMPEGKAPHFPQQPVARQNDDGSLELECFVDAAPQPTIKWYYDNNEVKSEPRFSQNLQNKGGDSYSAILSIKDLADSDAGAYRCCIVNPHGKGNANFNLKLTGFSSPTFVEKPQISSRDEGQVMVMEFRAKSTLTPTFVWHRLNPGGQVSEESVIVGRILRALAGGEDLVSENERIKIVLRREANDIYYAALEIKEPTKEKDAGQFICTAKNDSGKLTATFTVKFEVPEGAPSFTRKPQILQQTSAGGEPAICFDIGYTARLNPQVTWINPKGKKVKESSRVKFKAQEEGNGNWTAQLELTNYKAKDSGTYTCNIKNDAGEANVELTLNIEGPLDDGGDDSEA